MTKATKKIKSTRIFRAGNYIKPILVQIANGLLRSKKQPEITERYKRIKSHRGHKKAIIAVCRMLLITIWHILSDLKPYTSEGYLVQSVTLKTITQEQGFVKIKNAVESGGITETLFRIFDFNLQYLCGRYERKFAV